MQTPHPTSPPLSPSWSADDSRCGFFADDMSPLFSEESQGAAMSPMKSSSNGFLEEQPPQPARASAEAMSLGPSGPLHFVDGETALNTLMDYLQMTPCQSVAPTPVGSPVSSPKRAPLSLFKPLTLPAATASLQETNPVSQSHSQSHRSAQQSPLMTSSSVQALAAFLPPEVYSNKPPNASNCRPSSLSADEEHRSKSPFVKTNVLSLQNFSLAPTNTQAYVDCIATEPAVEALNLLEEEVQRMLRLITV